MAEKMAERPPTAPLTPAGLYFQIVCDPGHERTARELSQLPRESRERVWADMTGREHSNSGNTLHQSSSSASDFKHTPPQENSAFVQERLEALEGEIELLPPTEGLEMGLKTTLGNDSEFRLAFLRACDFDAAQAAQRFARHFEQKVMLFGNSKAGESIRLPDLCEDDLESLQCGAIQFLPKTDRGGRLVLVARYRNFVYKSPENLVRLNDSMHCAVTPMLPLLFPLSFTNQNLNSTSSYAATGSMVLAHVCLGYAER
jgi:hypothetical protein